MSGRSVWNVLNELVQGFLLDMPRSPSLESQPGANLEPDPWPGEGGWAGGEMQNHARPSCLPSTQPSCPPRLWELLQHERLHRCPQPAGKALDVQLPTPSPPGP